MSILTDLQEVMAQRRVRHAIEDGQLHVRGDLNLFGSLLRALPDGMTVHGSMYLHTTALRDLPAGLHITRNLSMTENRFLALRQDVVIGRDVSISHSDGMRLPEGFCVGRDLVLREGGPTRLPERLAVGGDLDLSRASVTRLPKTMHVGGAILPPQGLHDIDAYMRTQPDPEVTLGMPTTAHARLQLRTHLAGFPDLWTVLDSIAPQGHLILNREPDGKIQTLVIYL